MSVQGDRGTAEHAVSVALGDGLCTVFPAFNRVTLAGNRLAIHDVSIRTRCHGPTVRGHRVAHYNDLSGHQNLRCGCVSCLVVMRLSGAAYRRMSSMPGIPVSPLGLPRNVHRRSLGAMSMNCPDRKSTRLNSSHITISYAVFCLKKKKNYSTKPSDIEKTQIKKKKQ